MQIHKRKINQLITYLTLPYILLACNSTGSSPSPVQISGIPVAQQNIPRITEMDEIPQPFQIIDYKLLAESFDQTTFNWNASGESWPIIWMDYTYQNFAQPTFGLYTAIGDVRQGPNVESGIVHEAMAGMGSVLSATLVGIDKSNQDGFNYVAMLKNYFNRDTEWDIMMNNTNYLSGAAGGGYGRDWWYDIFPNVMFYAIADHYPEQQDFIGIERSIADKFYAANQDLNGNYDYFYYDYSNMTPGVFPQPPYTALKQQDAAAGHSWVMYAAYQKFGDAKYIWSHQCPKCT